MSNPSHYTLRFYYCTSCGDMRMIPFETCACGCNTIREVDVQSPHMEERDYMPAIAARPGTAVPHKLEPHGPGWKKLLGTAQQKK
jgi:hypothetical protein